MLSCKIYDIISKKHREKQVNFSFSFSPQSPIIQILLSSFKNGLFLEWDVNECLSFEENPGIWLMKIPIYKSYFKNYSYLDYDSVFL